MTPTFTPDTSIEEALRHHPDAADILKQHGLDCLGCLEAAYETLEQGADHHKIDLAALLAALNRLTASS